MRKIKKNRVKILVIDNFDSFTYNLVHYIEHITGVKPDVKRNNEIKAAEAGDYDKICISPGPGLPSEAGITKEVIRLWAPQKSVLGVCLGHQSLAEVFGGTLKNLDTVMHGVSRTVRVLKADMLFANIPERFEAGRYHSWVIDNPGILEVIAEDDDKNIMAVKHPQFNVYGVQFHPESIMTPEGMNIISNWILKT